MELPEEFAKRLDTLTRVAKLLVEQYQEQKMQIIRLQEEVAQLRVDLVDLRESQKLDIQPVKDTISKPKEFSKIDKKAVPSLKVPQEILEPTQGVSETKQKPDVPVLEKDSEKRAILDALKVIDDL